MWFLLCLHTDSYLWIPICILLMNIDIQLHMAPLVDHLPRFWFLISYWSMVQPIGVKEMKTFLDIWRCTLNLGQLENQDFCNRLSYLNPRFFIMSYIRFMLTSNTDGQVALLAWFWSSSVGAVIPHCVGKRKSHVAIPSNSVGSCGSGVCQEVVWTPDGAVGPISSLPPTLMEPIPTPTPKSTRSKIDRPTSICLQAQRANPNFPLAHFKRHF